MSTDAKLFTPEVEKICDLFGEGKITLGEAGAKLWPILGDFEEICEILAIALEQRGEVA